MSPITRRDFVKASVAALAAGKLLATGGASEASAEEQAQKPVRFAFIGVGARGTWHLQNLLALPGIEVVAICDLIQKKIDRTSEIVRRTTGTLPEGYCGDEYYYRKMLERDDFDVVLIATPVRWHAEMSIDAMNTGKHVGSEIPACRTVKECRALIQAKETNGVRYFMMENYLFLRPTLSVLNMVRGGLFGEPYYAECGNLQEFKSGLYEPDGSLNWRGESVQYERGNNYPTHAGGPVFKWFGINEGDRLEKLTCYATTPNRTGPLHYTGLFGEDKASRLPFKMGEMNTCLLSTEKGKVIKIDNDILSNRPQSFYYLLQGTRGIYDNRFGIYTVGDDYPTAGFTDAQWQDPNPYFEAHDHDLWEGGSGSSTADRLTIRHLVEMVRQDREPWCDVYDAATWSSIYELSQKSLDRGSAAVKLPDFTGGNWRNPDWRGNAMRA